MKVLLVANYKYDGSYSMQLFSNVLYCEMQKKGVDVNIISPRPIIGSIGASYKGIGKWLGYVDRFILFPFYLGRIIKKYDIIHFCDHGSAVYIRKKWKISTIVTCHDMIAVRGALGEVSDCAPSLLGKIQQKMISNGIKKATMVACVSEATREDVERVLGVDYKSVVVNNGLNYDYKVLDKDEVSRRLKGVVPQGIRYMLHVGTNQPRKNRTTVIKILSAISRHVDMYLVIAGRLLDGDLLKLAADLNVKNKIIQIYRPPAEMLEALYNKAEALVFPSHYEGFGWPVVEAQACGCPVIASDIKPFREILKNTAVLCGADDADEMALHLINICNNEKLREQMVISGKKNVDENYSKLRMINRYIEHYEDLA